MEYIKKFFRTHEWLAVAVFVVLFVIIRLPAVNFPLHQDEYKWPKIVNPAFHSDTEIPHPPLSQFIYRTAGEIVGFNVHFRFVPIFFGSINLLLLYYFLRSRFGRRIAFVGISVWTLSFFSILASLMVDTDGEILPFFFLLSLICYDKVKIEKNKRRLCWLGACAVSVLLGAFIKVSFLLVPVAYALDLLWERRKIINRRQIVVYGAYALSFITLFVILLVLAQKLFPFFNLKVAFTYWEHFWNTDRGWFQTAIQTVKAILYSSPLLLITFFGTRKDITDTKLFYIFIAVAVFFYTIAFDFSIGALDRYFQFLILPLSVISAVVLGRIHFTYERRYKEYVLLGSIVALTLVLLQAVPHYIPPLHPKAEWIHRILSLRWNFVYPFSGGSGPLGFYISFLFLGLSWVYIVVLALATLLRPHKKTMLISLGLPLMIVYNLVFASEYMFGVWNGSAPRLLTKAIAYIEHNPDIKKVTTYNDNGGDELQEIGKYRKRLYTDPKFDINEKIATLNTYKEHYFVLDVPRIDPNSIYAKYLSSCRILYTEVDKKMSATVYDCTKNKDITAYDVYVK